MAQHRINILHKHPSYIYGSFETRSLRHRCNVPLFRQTNVKTDPGGKRPVISFAHWTVSPRVVLAHCTTLSFFRLNQVWSAIDEQWRLWFAAQASLVG
jgi:hypothetical protein